ncbi:guanylate kinase, partial [Klebsiella pneumoniae]|nr:guanylate kinase [Klebsiella pneumoniae]
ARNVRSHLPEAISVFLAPPSWDDLVARLTARGTETPEVAARRLETARVEMAARDEFEHVVVNSDVDVAAEELLNLLVG